MGSNAIDQTLQLKRAWSYMSEKETHMESWKGLYGHYDGSGYAADLAAYDRRWRHFQSDLDELRKYQWLDPGTRALFLHLMLYNPSVNVFSSVEFIFEMPFTGGIFPSYRISHRELIRVDRFIVEHYRCSFLFETEEAFMDLSSSRR